MNLLSPKEQIRATWANIFLVLGLLATFLGGGILALSIGLPWLLSLPSALSSTSWQPTQAKITVFEPLSCGRNVGGHLRGIHYSYTFEGKTYDSTRVLPGFLNNDHLESCGENIWRNLMKNSDSNGNYLVVAYVDQTNPGNSVLYPGIPISNITIISLLCLFFVISAVVALPVSTYYSNKARILYENLYHEKPNNNN